MIEMDPIVKTVGTVLVATSLLIVVIIAVTQNNPAFAQIFMHAMGIITNTLTGYNNVTARLANSSLP
jgi:hypothetical protein